MAQLAEATLGGKHGIDVLHDPQLNKSTAFTEPEREALGLTGLLPAGRRHAKRRRSSGSCNSSGQKPTDLERYIYLIGLLDTDETLFYKVLMSDPARFLADCVRPDGRRGLPEVRAHLPPPAGHVCVARSTRGRVKEVLRNWPAKDVRVICATSGGRILGLGDLGANGMGIPIGKLQLYTACAARAAAVSAADAHRLRHQQPGAAGRPALPGPAPAARLGRRNWTSSSMSSCEAVQEVFPGCCIHFEDWAGVDAMRLLARYRDRVCCYNDDIQGTAGVALAGLLSALARDRRQAPRPAHFVPRRRLGRHRHRRPDRLGHDAGRLDQGPGAGADFAVRHQRPARTEPHRPVTTSRSPMPIRTRRRATSWPSSSR